MKVLIVEDDYITSQVMNEILSQIGECDIAEDGLKGIELFADAHNAEDPYDVIFLDIMMPEIDGQEVLFQIRDIEKERKLHGLDGVRIIMTTALDDFDNIKKAFKNQAEGYIVKPVDKDKIYKVLKDLSLL